MKKHTLIIAFSVILITGVLLAGCTAVIIKKEAGPTTTKEYNFTDFDSIEIGHAFKLEVTPADTYSITINANESDFDHIDVSKTGNKLEIGIDALIFRSHRSPRVKITMPELRGLYLSGASEGNVTGFKSNHDFDLTLSGASELNMDIETGAFECEISGMSEVAGYLKATRCNIELSGASEIELFGSGGNIKLDASGTSQVDLVNFTVDDADIRLTGASEASVEVKGRLDADLGDLSTLEYSGNFTLGDLNITGGSELKQR